MTTPSGSPNSDQIAYWNEQVGTTWVQQQAQIDKQIRPLGLVAMDRAGLRPGARVLDIGCGCGDTTLELARRVAPDGRVTAVDISAPMLARAREAAAAAGAAAEFLQADAQTHAFAPASFDIAFSRFGVMFFADPTAAFTNIRRAIVGGGRLAFVCWQALPDNPWMLTPFLAAMPHLPPITPPPPDAPGPFAFADPQRVRDILAGAGFSAIEIEPLRQSLLIGGADLDAAVDFLLRMGPTARALREAGDPALTGRVAAAVREAMAPFHTPEGVKMDSAAWVVTATA
ncbi:MAG: methyltransferase domain-containing protein [Deltaproteobacteria bacterium]|nr:methyltransferase domain-containing protein [Deltaproteobacteria bacterium]